MGESPFWSEWGAGMVFKAEEAALEVLLRGHDFVQASGPQVPGASGMFPHLSVHC